MLKLKGDTIVVGDIHGDPLKLLWQAPRLDTHPGKIKHVILLGDIGFGFVRKRYHGRLSAVAAMLDCVNTLDDVDDDAFSEELNYCVNVSARELILSIMSAVKILTGNRDVQVYAIRGNHDNPAFWDSRTKQGKTARLEDKNFHFLKDGFIEINKELWLTIGGGVSVDRFIAQRVEGVTWWAGEEINGNFNKPLPVGYKKLTGILSHTGEVPPYADYKLPDSYEGWVAEALKREQQALESLAVRYNPKYWVYGHFHRAWESDASGEMRFICVAQDDFLILNKTRLKSNENMPRNRF